MPSKQLNPVSASPMGDPNPVSASPHGARGPAALVFGYDLFISFALGKPPRGTRAYASDLARKLRERGFTVFFSEDEAPAGDHLDTALKRALLRSRILVVVANRGMLAAPRWVRKEVEEFRSAHPGRKVIAVNIDGALQDAELHLPTQQWLQFQGKIWIDEVPGADTAGIADDSTVDRLATAPTSSRSAVRLRAVVIGIGLLLAGAAAFAMWQRSQAVEYADTAEKNANRAEVQRAHAQENAASAAEEARRADAAEKTAVFERDLAVAARVGEATQRRVAERNLIEARLQERAAVAARSVAESRELAARSAARLEQDDATAALVLAIEAAKRADTSEARKAIVAAVAESRSLARLPHEGPLYKAAFIQGDRWVVTASSKSIRIWNAQSVALEREIEVLNLRGLAVSQDGQTLLTAEQGRARLISASTGADLQAFRDKFGYQTAFVAFSPTEQMIVTTSGASAYLWDAASGKLLATLSGHSGLVLHAAFSPDGRLLATAGGDSNSASVWDVASVLSAGNVTPANSLGRVNTGGKNVTVAFSPDGLWLLTGSHGSGAKAWPVGDIRGPNSSTPVTLHEGSVVPIAFSSASASHIATGGLDGLVRIHTLEKSAYEFQATLTATRLPLDVLNQKSSVRDQNDTNLSSTLAFDRSGTRLVTASGGGAVKIWLLEPATFMRPGLWRMAVRLRGSRAWVRAAAFNADGTRVVTAGNDGVAQIWDPGPRAPLPDALGMPIADLIARADRMVPANLKSSEKQAFLVK